MITFIHKAQIEFKHGGCFIEDKEVLAQGVLLYLANKMSNLRNYRHGLTGPISKSRTKTIIESQSRAARERHSKLEESTLFNQTRCHTIDAGHQQIHKDIVYNKNISYFRQSFKLTDTHLLPFLASLRTNTPQLAKQKPVTTAISPFQAERVTFNQKTKKSINDMRANAFRLSKINYRWHNASGAGVRTTCEFQCGLRLFNDSANPEQSSFKSTITPIRMQTVQPYRYRQNELICPRQKRIFTLQK